MATVQFVKSLTQQKIERLLGRPVGMNFTRYVCDILSDRDADDSELDAEYVGELFAEWNEA